MDTKKSVGETVEEGLWGISPYDFARIATKPHCLPKFAYNPRPLLCLQRYIKFVAGYIREKLQ